MRKKLIGLVALGLLLVPTQFLNAAAIKDGGSCTKLGLSKIINGYKFTCSKTGKKLAWDKGVAITKPTPTPTPTPTTTTTPNPNPSSNPAPRFPHLGDSCKPTPYLTLRYSRTLGLDYADSIVFLSCSQAGTFIRIWDGTLDKSGSVVFPNSSFILNDFESYDSTSRTINNLVETFKNMPDKKASTKFEYVIEPISESKFTDTIKSDFEKSANFYLKIGMLPKYSKIVVVLHTTQEFFQKKFIDLCKPGASSTNTNWAGVSMGTCDNENGTGFIALNVAGISTGNFFDVDPTTNLDSLTTTKDSLFSLAMNPPHEFFHAFQSSFNPKFMNEAPVWLIEGSAQFMALLTLGVYGVSENSYLENLAMQLEDYVFTPLYPSGCLKSVSTLNKYQTNECSYWQGIFPIETLVANHGGLATLARLIEGLNSGDFSKDFKSATGLDLEQFYKEADIHSKYYGFASNT